MFSIVNFIMLRFVVLLGVVWVGFSSQF